MPAFKHCGQRAINSMKKTIILFLVLAMILSMTACKSDEPSSTPTDPPNSEHTDSTNPTQPEFPQEEFVPADTALRLIALFNKYPMSFPVSTNELSLTNNEEVKRFLGVDNVTSMRHASIMTAANPGYIYMLALVDTVDEQNAEALRVILKDGVQHSKWSGAVNLSVETASYKNYVLLVLMSNDLKTYDGEQATAEAIADMLVETMNEYDSQNNQNTDAPTRETTE